MPSSPAPIESQPTEIRRTRSGPTVWPLPAATTSSRSTWSRRRRGFDALPGKESSFRRDPCRAHLRSRHRARGAPAALPREPADEGARMKAVVLAAGYATRLYPLTLDRPKPLLEVGGRPMLDWVHERLELMGVDETIV